MAHVKASGATRQGTDIKGKRRGVKKFGGQQVISGNILVRQKGTKFFPGLNTLMGRDFTIYATKTGFVQFRRMTRTKRNKFYVDVSEELTPKKDLTSKKAAPVAAAKAKVTKSVPTKKTIKNAKEVKN